MEVIEDTTVPTSSAGTTSFIVLVKVATNFTLVLSANYNEIENDIQENSIRLELAAMV
jgi:hypothetical protein